MTQFSMPKELTIGAPEIKGRNLWNASANVNTEGRTWTCIQVYLLVASKAENKAFTTENTKLAIIGTVYLREACVVCRSLSCRKYVHSDGPQSLFVHWNIQICNMVNYRMPSICVSGVSGVPYPPVPFVNVPALS